MSSWFFLIFILSMFQTGFLSSPSPSPAPQLCLHEERYALLQLKQEQYHVHRSSKYHLLKSWKPDTDCCYWEGITCDDNTGHVVGLDLSGTSHYLSTHFNSCLFHLRHLQTRDISRNAFEYYGPPGYDRLSRYSQLEIPNLRAYVQKLPNLRELRLDGVNLSGHENRDWCHHVSSALPNLQVLSMINCSLTGPLDASISSLRFLSELRLDLNQNLSSTVPSSLVNLTSLAVLGLSYCGFQGDFPTNVFLHPNLMKIYITGNPLLSVHLPEFPQVNSSLQYLSVGSTKFQGKLPSSVGNLKFLKGLYLWGCNISGPIPPSLANLTHLTKLVLSSNHFSGQIPSSFFTGRFSNLEILYLDDNLLQGFIPSDLFFLPSLSMLDLSDNQFSGFKNNLSFHSSTSSNNLPINRSSDNFVINSQLQLLWMRSCNISKFPNFHMNQKELTSLDLSCNRIRKFPDFLKDLKALRDLDISSNRIDGAIPNWIWQKNLSFLNLSNNLLTGLEFPLPNYSFNFTAIDLHSNMIHTTPYSPQTPNQSNSTEFVSPILRNLMPLLSIATAFFSISNNKLIGSIPPSICHARNLDILELSNNQLSGTIPKCLGSINLEVLNLESNKLHGPIPPTLKTGCGLHTLKLNRNMLQGQVPRSLANCEELEVLDIGENQLNDTFPYWLGSLSKLQVLVMRSNNFGGPIEQLSDVDSPFPNLHVFDISVNTFTGNLPLHYIIHWNAMKTDDDNSRLNYISFQSSVGYYYQDTVDIVDKGIYMEMRSIVTTFTTVDLSNNKFNGGIPDAMADLKSLMLLNLSGNNLTGQIPSSLGNLRNLEALDLSRNNLSGYIPSQLTSLTFLSILNLSDNNFTGSIPQGKQFDTFSNTSYEGNILLCGFPLSRKCGITERAFPPTLTLQQQEDSTCLLDWKFAIAGYCSGLIIGVVIGQQLFWGNNQFFKWSLEFRGSKQNKVLKREHRTRGK